MQAAQDATAGQTFPVGALYVVATPIGNLADITLRALRVLQLADVIACEDTRHTQTLLRAFDIDKAPTQLLAVHQHNEAQAIARLRQVLQQGLRVAYVSDAGTPAVSDPGARLVAGIVLAGLPVVPVPGASSVTTALSVAGLRTDADHSSGFVFAGFLPNKTLERATAVQALANETRAVVLLEAPHRIEALAQALAALGQRRLTIGRELTKQFENVVTLNAADFAGWLASDAQRNRGEFVLVLHPRPSQDQASTALSLLPLLLAELPLKTAVKLAAAITGEPRNDVYALALTLKEGDA